MRRRTLRNRLETRIARKRGDVFLPREFRDLGGEDQVLRVLRGLVREGRLVRLGYGVYGRAVRSRLSGEPLLYSANGFEFPDAPSMVAFGDIRYVSAELG